MHYLLCRSSVLLDAMFQTGSKLTDIPKNLAHTRRFAHYFANWVHNLRFGYKISWYVSLPIGRKLLMVLNLVKISSWGYFLSVYLYVSKFGYQFLNWAMFQIQNWVSLNSPKRRSVRKGLIVGTKLLDNLP